SAASPGAPLDLRRSRHRRRRGRGCADRHGVTQFRAATTYSAILQRRSVAVRHPTGAGADRGPQRDARRAARHPPGAVDVAARGGGTLAGGLPRHQRRVPRADRAARRGVLDPRRLRLSPPGVNAVEQRGFQATGRSGPTVRAGRSSGRRWGAANGSVSALSTELNTRKMFDRGNGVMLEPEPCSRLASNHSAVPGGPVNWSITCWSATLVSVV